MDPITHVTTGLVISQLLPLPSRWLGALAGVIFALLPDLDYFLVFQDRLAFIRHHRGFTHSLMAMPLFALLGASVGRMLGGPRWFRPLFYLGLAVLASHLLLDLATSYGTQIFNPLSRRKLALDWIFIIDPYLTGILLLGTVAALLSAGWGRQVAAVCLTLAGAYLALCGLYHHQALNLARQVFGPDKSGAVKVAALPQPFSCRRWQLLAAGPEGIRQTFVQLPYLSFLGLEAGVQKAQAAMVNPGPNLRAPEATYEPPGHLIIQNWPNTALHLGEYSPEARQILEAYLDFARFPLLARRELKGDDQFFSWLDLRFTVPGRSFPFILQLHLDRRGHLQKWQIGRGGGEGKK
ncbi:MAG: metal-dependent hydrolase [Thermodesulfobacteriota bacterium]